MALKLASQPGDRGKVGLVRHTKKQVDVLWILLFCREPSDQRDPEHTRKADRVESEGERLGYKGRTGRGWRQRRWLRLNARLDSFGRQPLKHPAASGGLLELEPPLPFVTMLEQDVLETAERAPAPDGPEKILAKPANLNG
jgi:hypothetical protein